MVFANVVQFRRVVFFSSNKLTIGAIIGISLACLVGVIFIVIVVRIILRKNNRYRKFNDEIRASQTVTPVINNPVSTYSMPNLLIEK